MPTEMTTAARHELKRLGHQDRRKAAKLMQEASEDPYGAGKQLVGNMRGLITYRDGKLRAVAEIIDGTLLFRSIGYRRHCYLTTN